MKPNYYPSDFPGKLADTYYTELEFRDDEYQLRESVIETMTANHQQVVEEAKPRIILVGHVPVNGVKKIVRGEEAIPEIVRVGGKPRPREVVDETNGYL